VAVAGEALFNDEALEAAARQGIDSHVRWLALSPDPEAIALRAGLEHCFTFAGRSAGVLRKGLMHERWGQHAGALGHLLTLGLLVRQGWAVTAEPELGGQSPDILATRNAPGAEPRAATGACTGHGMPPELLTTAELRMLVEVRAITGAGRFPWEARRELRGPGRASPAEREAQARATAASAEALRETVAAVLGKKAERYAALVERLALPFVICLYEDKDDQIAGIAREVAFGSASDSSRIVSAVIVFGRIDTRDGALLLRGEIIPDPEARFPLPPDAWPLLRTLPAGMARMGRAPLTGPGFSLHA